MQRAQIIVVGNAKGGSGKSTTAMHVITRLMAMGKKVAAIDLDAPQQTLGRYVQNRQQFAATKAIALPVPEFCVVPRGDASEKAVYTQLCGALEDFLPRHDVVVVDCPGSDNFAARLGHSFADTLLTPINDSFIDVDLLAQVDAQTFRIVAPGWYSEMVWEQRKRRFLKDGYRIDWVVMRNRLTHVEARNKRRVADVLTALAPRIGFRHVHGLGERVIYRELFLRGLTLSDLRTPGIDVPLTMTHVAAHQEVRDLVTALLCPRPAPAMAARQAAS